MPRPLWEGHLKLSLVTCAVSLYTATTRTRDISFHLLHKDTMNRIRMIPTDPEIGPVERSDLVKGYEVEKDQYIVLDKEDFESVRLEATKTIEIDRFVSVDSIDRIYWDDPLFLVPNGKVAVEAYAVIRQAMENAGQLALGSVVLHNHERQIAIEPRGKGMIAYTLRNHDEVRDPEEMFDDIPAVKPDKKMVEIALKIVEQQEGPFDPSRFRDRYEDALRALIEERQSDGGDDGTVQAAPPAESNVIDLMDALKKSLAGKGRAASRPKTAAKSAPRRAATRRAKSTPKKRRAAR
ncbi:Ku protein [Desertibaculum subflavum]|uniref:non-homologous end joining protein Ku n=1 Tax=Desertibaculum subflavum TaxID=2268458 RepID=UPI000E661B5B